MSIDEIYGTWAEKQKAEREKAASKLREFLKNNPEILRIEIDYDGSGDSGCIESVIFFNTDGEIYNDDEHLDEDTPSDYVYYLLDYKSPGWEINEGSFGKITITPGNDGEITVDAEHNVRYESYETEGWEETL